MPCILSAGLLPAASPSGMKYLYARNVHISVQGWAAERRRLRLGNKFAHLARVLSICEDDLLAYTSMCVEDEELHFQHHQEHNLLLATDFNQLCAEGSKLFARFRSFWSSLRSRSWRWRLSRNSTKRDLTPMCSNLDRTSKADSRFSGSCCQHSHSNCTPPTSVDIT